MHYPLFIDVAGKEVLVIGCGKVGSRRAKYLLEAGAKVTVIDKGSVNGIQGLDVERINADVMSLDVDYSRYFMVIVATNDKKVNKSICQKALERSVLVCNTSDPAAGDVMFPMVANVAGHTLAYTTLGENPKLLKAIKGSIEKEYGSE